MNIEKLQLNFRAQNILKAANCATAEDILKLGALQLEGMRSSGIKTLQIITRALLCAGYSVSWLKSRAEDFMYDLQPFKLVKNKDGKTERTMDGFYRITSPYLTGENWMLESAIAQLARDGIAWCVGEDKCLWRSLHGVKLLPDDDDEELIA